MFGTSIQNNTFVYNKFTKEDFDNAISSLSKKFDSVRDYNIVTSWIGMVLFDLAMLGLTISLPKYYCEIVKKGKYLYVIHIGKRHNLIKAYVNKKHQFEIKKGTKLLFTTQKLDKFIFNKIKEYE